MELKLFLGSMYVWAIALLLLSAGLATKTLGIVPINLGIAIVVCAVLDILLKKFYLKREEIKFPFSAVISGIIIGSIVPFVASPIVILLACAVAIGSKFFIKLKGAHIFNPATLGLLVSLSVFSLADEWWGTIGFNILGFTLPVTVLLIIANYKAGKLKTALPFLLITALLYNFSGLAKLSSFTTAGLLSFIGVLPFYFAFIMLSEPKTSPYNLREQIIFGVSLAVLNFLMEFYNIGYSFFIALLIGNFAYFAHRNYFAAKVQVQLGV